MKITGVTFVGTRTEARSEMAAFLHDVLELSPAAPTAGMDAEVFDLPDGSSFAVTSATPGDDARTVGLSVDGIDEARERLAAAGVWTDDEIAVNDRFRYLHFRAPDGQLYELVEERWSRPVR